MRLPASSGSRRSLAIPTGTTSSPFLAASLSPDIRPVAWFSRRRAHDYAGFLWWLWQLGDAPCEVIDITDMTFTYHGKDGKPRLPNLAVSPSLLLPEHMANLLDRAAPLDPAERVDRATCGSA